MRYHNEFSFFSQQQRQQQRYCTANRHFDACFFGYIATYFSIFCGCIWFLGYFVSPAIATNIDRITGPEAVERLSEVLGDPAQFENDMKDNTQDFIRDHFGTMAIAAAFGIAIRMRS